MKFSCTTCQGKFTAEREHLGTEIQCPHCGEALLLPTESEIGAGSLAAAAPTARQYWCFLSYRHNDNKQEGRQWATWLHQAIETYEVPADLVGTRNDLGEEIPSRIFPVFRDEEELPADADLSRPIVRALHNSRYLVALCSPGAVESRFVADEITRFKAMGKSDRIIAAIVAGEPNASSSTDPALADQECFPLPLRYEVESDGTISGRPAEPVAADFRLEDGSQGWTSPEAYRERLKREGWKSAEIDRLVHRYEKRLSLMTLKVIAGILGVELGVLTKRDKAYQIALARRRTAVLMGWLALAGVLAVAAIAGGVVALRNSREAIAQRDQARFNEGLGWLLRAEVAEERGKRYPETLLYAAQAIGFEGVGRPENAGEEPLRYIRQDRDPEAFERARQWIDERPAYRPIWASPVRHNAPVSAMDISSSGRWLALAHQDGRLALWDLASGDETVISQPDASPAADLAFDPDEKFLGIAYKFQLHVWDLEKKTITVERPGFGGTVAWSPGGDFLVSAGAKGDVTAWEGEKQIDLAAGLTTSAARLVFSPDNSFCATAHPALGVRLFFPHSGVAAYSWSAHEGDAASVAVSPDGARLALGAADGAVSLWSAIDAKQLGVVPAELRHRGAVHDLSFHPAADRLASASSDGTVRLWDIRASIPSLIATLAGHTGPVTRVRYAPGGDTLASAGDDGTVKLWAVTGEAEAQTDWFAYLDRSNYRFDPGTQAAIWAGGTGYHAVPPGTLIAAWHAGGRKPVDDYFFARGLWSAAARMGGDIAQSRAALVADVEKTAVKKRWHHVDLRLRQIGALGGPELDGRVQDLVTLRNAEFPVEGKPFTTGEGQAMIWCPSGEFEMGKSDQPGAFFRHRVKLTQAFWLAKFEVTQAQYEAVMGHNPSTNIASGPQAPAENLSWSEALEFCRRLTDRERARGSIPRGWEYTLPTEAQWEYACRAGTTTRWSFGDDEKEFYRHGNFNDKRGNFGTGADKSQDDGHEYTAPVGSYRPNPWGFYDMHGNVYEWCRDAMDLEKADYPAGPVTDPLVTRGPDRVNRGGSFSNAAAGCRSAFRSAHQPSYRYNFLGFRPALVSAGQPVQYEP